MAVPWVSSVPVPAGTFTADGDGPVFESEVMPEWSEAAANTASEPVGQRMCFHAQHTPDPPPALSNHNSLPQWSMAYVMDYTDPPLSACNCEHWAEGGCELRVPNTHSHSMATDSRLAAHAAAVAAPSHHAVCDVLPGGVLSLGRAICAGASLTSSYVLALMMAHFPLMQPIGLMSVSPSSNTWRGCMTHDT